MKKRALVMASIAIISVASIGGFAFAKGTDTEIEKNNKGWIATEDTETFNNYNSHCGNNEEMLEIMRENGFEDMAQWMEEGNYEAMNEFMNNMSDEDYNKMIDLMNENGYENMSSMMESIGREGMVNMHNSMMGNNGSWFNMMGR